MKEDIFIRDDTFEGHIVKNVIDRKIEDNMLKLTYIVRGSAHEKWFSLNTIKSVNIMPRK